MTPAADKLAQNKQNEKDLKEALKAEREKEKQLKAEVGRCLCGCCPAAVSDSQKVRDICSEDT